VKRRVLSALIIDIDLVHNKYVELIPWDRLVVEEIMVARQVKKSHITTLENPEGSRRAYRNLHVTCL
jgi:hypothetical protein